MIIQIHFYKIATIEEDAENKEDKRAGKILAPIQIIIPVIEEEEDEEEEEEEKPKKKKKKPKIKKAQKIKNLTLSLGEALKLITEEEVLHCVTLILDTL